MIRSFPRRDALAEWLRAWQWPAVLLGLAVATAVGVATALIALREPRLALVLLGAPIFALMVHFPRHTFYGLVVIFPLMIGMPRGTAGIPILRPAEALLVVAFGAIILSQALQYPWRFRFTTVDMGMFLLFVSGILIPFLVATWRGQRITTENMNVLVGPIRFYMIYLAGRAVITSREHVRTVIHCMLGVSVVIAFLAICQKYELFGVADVLSTYFMDASTREHIYLAWRNPDLFRASSVFNGSWNTLGSYMAFTLLIAIFYGETVRTVKGSLAIYFVIAMCSMGLILSGNVASTSALLGGIALGSLYLRRPPRAVIPLIIGAIMAAIFFSEFISLRLMQQFGSTQDTVLASSFSYRIDLWVTEFLPALRGYEILGVGPDLPESVWWGTEESQYLFVLYKGGVIYLIGYLLWAALSVAMCVVLLRHRDQLVRMLALPIILIVIGLMYMGISNAYATYSAPMSSLWILFAIVSSVSIWSPSNPEPARAETNAQLDTNRPDAL
jgi:hypothetical protein